MQKLINKCKNHKRIFLIALIVIVSMFKIFCIFNIGHKSDLFGFHYNWCKYISSNNIFSIYSTNQDIPSIFSINYPPIFLFLLWPISGFAVSAFDAGNFALYLILVKLPIILLNILFTIYLYKKVNKYFAIFWYCNPLLIFDTEIWGQTDSLLCAVIILFILSITKHSYIKSSIFFAIGCLLKLQMCYLFPVFLILILKSKNLKNIILSLFAGGTVGVLGWLPFVLYNKDILLPIRIYLNGPQSQTSLNYNSCNFFSLFGNVEISDINILGLNGITLNMILLCTIITISCILLYKAQTAELEILYTAFYLFSIYMFTFSQHERYLIPTATLFTLLAFLYNKKYTIFFITTSISSIICMVIAFITDYLYWNRQPFIPSVLSSTMFSLAFIIAFFIYFYLIYVIFTTTKKIKDTRGEVVTKNID